MVANTIRESTLAGLSFGLASGVITTFGLLVGLAAGTESRLAVIWRRNCHFFG